MKTVPKATDHNSFFVIYWDLMQRQWEVTCGFDGFEQASAAYEVLKSKEFIREILIAEKVGGSQS